MLFNARFSAWLNLNVSCVTLIIQLRDCKVNFFVYASTVSTYTYLKLYIHIYIYII